MTRNRFNKAQFHPHEEPHDVQHHIACIERRCDGAVRAQPVEAAMQSHLHGSEPELTLFAVRSIDDIEGLVKESEVVTGLACRTFVVAGADRLFYELSQHRKGFRLQRLDISGEVLYSEHLLTFELLE